MLVTVVMSVTSRDSETPLSTSSRDYLVCCALVPLWLYLFIPAMEYACKHMSQCFIEVGSEDRVHCRAVSYTYIHTYIHIRGLFTQNMRVLKESLRIVDMRQSKTRCNGLSIKSWLAMSNCSTLYHILQHALLQMGGRMHCIDNDPEHAFA